MDSNVSDDNNATQFVDKLLRENDLRGAIGFGKQMQNLFPNLKRLWQFLANIVLQVSSDDEEVDWYSVLGVDPLADLQTMKKQYVQLAKGGSLGSMEAHKLLNKAWDTLSGRFSRIDYDIRRKSRELQQNTMAVNQESLANEIFSQGFSSINNALVSNQNSSNNDCSIGGSDQRDDFTDQTDQRIEYVHGGNSRELQEEDLDENQESSANEIFSQGFSNDNNVIQSNQISSNNECSIGGSDHMNDLTDQREISGMDWESFRNPEANYAPHEQSDTFLTACPSCHYESPRVCLISKADCLQCGKAFAALEVPSPDGNYKEWMDLVQGTDNSIKTVPGNHMPIGSDAQGGAYLGQTGNSREEKVGSSKTRNGNGKKRLSDVERNTLTKKAKKVILNQKHEYNAAAMDYTMHTLKTVEVLPDSECHGLDQDRTQESSIENQLRAIYLEIMEYYKHLLCFDAESAKEAIETSTQLA